MSPTETKEGAEVELFVGYGDDNPNAVVAPDHNRDPQDVVTAAIDNNADIGVVIDMNGTKADHRGDNLEENERAQGILDAYWELGGNFIDTADSYAGGRSETLIGAWMHEKGNRDQIIVGTKIGRSAENPGLSSEAVFRAIEASLLRLGTDYIDLLYLDVDDDSVPFEETLVAVDENVRKGRVRHVGVSDHSGNRLIEARVIAAQLGLTPLIAVQSRYNLTHRTEFEGALARVAAQQRLGVMPRFALDGGFLAGNYRAKTELDLNTTGNIVLGGDAQKHFNRRGQRILAALDRIAAEHETVPATIAIAWLLSKPNIVARAGFANRITKSRWMQMPWIERSDRMR